MKIKKITALVLAIIMAITVFSLPLSAKTVIKKSADGNWKYQLFDDGTASIYSGELYKAAYLNTDTTKLTVPATVDGHTVVSIGEHAFYKNSKLTEVTVPGSITLIDSNAFESCTALTKLTLKDGVKSIGSECFKGCGALASFTFPDSLTSIGARSFTDTAFYKSNSNWEDGGLYIGHHLIRVGNVTDFTVKDGTLNLAFSAFSGCNRLESIEIPDSVTHLFWNAVGSLPALKSIFVGSGNENYCSVDGVVFTKDLSGILIYPAGKEDAEYALPDGVKEIADNAFRGNSFLTSVVIPDSTERIGIFAFLNCTSLENITMGSGVKGIENSAFMSTAYFDNEDNWENGVLYIGDCLIKAKNTVTAHDIKDGTRTVATSAFSGCKELASISIPESVQNIGEFAFYFCQKLVSVELPEGMTEIRASCFESCIALQSILIPDSVDVIGNLAFNNCPALKKVYGYRFSPAEDFANENGIEFVSLGNSKLRFPDVKKGSWYYDAVMYCADKGFVHGYQNGYFGPADNLQRQDFVVILANIAGADLSGYTSCKLTDVQMSAYYGKAVAWAVDKGIIAGYQNGKFGVGDPITREQVATILYRYMRSPGVDNVDATLAKFPDKGNISDFAKTPLAWAVQNNVITGMQDGTVAPKGSAVRAQIASIIMRMDLNGMFNA